jgi:3-phenylpropionate/trans-cinnamate dioxygenase ferredoxin subunit
MAEFITVATTQELPNSGDRIVIEIDEHAIAVFNVDHKYYAIEDLCTHDDGPLADGILDGAEIECPRHGARFDVRTGKVLRFPAIKDVPRYEVRLQGDEIQLLI